MKFRDDMIQAILDGTKTQTRRPIKPEHKTGDGVPVPPYKAGDTIPVEGTDINLEITRVHFQRMKEISDMDALAEGIGRHIPVPGDGAPVYKNYLDGNPFLSPRASFLSLWASIYGVGSTHENPLVWVYEFKKV